MKSTDLVLANAGIQKVFLIEVNNAIKELVEGYTAPKGLSNSETDQAHIMHSQLIRHELISSMNSYTKKEVDKSKKHLDECLARLGLGNSGVPGKTTDLYNDGTLNFAKKQNKDSTSTLVVDLLTELARLGVEKAVVDKAMAKATKSKRGNVYYEITVV